MRKVIALQDLGVLKKGKKYPLVKVSDGRYVIDVGGYTVSYLAKLFTY